MFDRRFSVAPMMDWTDRHDRYFLRLIAPHVLLYTEMITTGALIHGDRARFLAFDPSEHPLALQLGGSDPEALARSAKWAADAGYDEVNLNVGCPSARVKSGRFGACLLREPELVSECIAAMKAAVTIPISLKCRIGVDEHDSHEVLAHFVESVAKAGCQIFIIHARKAWLSGLSPKQNREVPPLCYERVRQIKQAFPHLTIIVNGGISTLSEIETHLQWADGVMLGRAAYSNPYFLADIEQRYFPSGAILLTREEVVEKYILYLVQQIKNNVKLSAMTRHILGLFQGQPGAKRWRRYLSENAYLPQAGVEVVRNALADEADDEKQTLRRPPPA